MQEFDFAIVGAGIAGVSAAYHLAPAARVIVLEREHVAAYHTTGRSAALHSETYGSPEIRAITVASGRFYRAPPAGFADHPLLTPRGALIAGRADQQAAMRKAADDYARLVPSVRWLDSAETLRLQPLLKPQAVGGGAIFEPEADDMDVAAIHGGFLRGARSAGAILRLNAEVASLARKDGRWQIALRDGESLAATTIVNAAGAWADTLGALAGARPIGLVPKRRTAFTFDSPTGLALAGMPMAIDFDETFYFKPEVGQFLASPADETPSPPCDAQPEEIDIAVAVERIETATTLQIRRIKNKWAGLRSFVADKNLVVGYDPAVEGFFWLAGQGGYGIQTAAAAGRLATSLALGRGLPGDIAELGVDESRFPPAASRSGDASITFCCHAIVFRFRLAQGMLGMVTGVDMGKFTLLAASAAALFAASATTAVRADGTVKCGGINSCKGTSSCKTELSSCKGKNSCKGLGWTTVDSAEECTAKGGKVV